MQPPARFAETTFARYRAQTPSQIEALEDARAFVRTLRREQARRRGWWRWLPRRPLRWRGLYLVGPVGTGKTHLLAAMYHALTPEVPCAFLHSSTLFRMTEHPEALARRLADDYRVLCLDEVELDDPANEARLVLLLKALSERGVILLATSNVEPDRFLAATYGGDRFRRFLHEEFQQVYRVTFVGGDDYRRQQTTPGQAWVGPASRTRPAMRALFEAEERRARWLTFDDLLHQARETEHTRLVGRLARADALYLEDIRIRHTDDALRLLRLIDDLYLRPEPPVLYFTARQEPDAWFHPEGQREGLERGIAEKFSRTVSRLYALCRIEMLDAPTTA
jgi:cell division protein ZapE